MPLAVAKHISNEGAAIASIPARWAQESRAWIRPTGVFSMIRPWLHSCCGPRRAERRQGLRTGWRVELPNWSGIPVAARRLYLRIVGDYGGEWWGQGRAGF